MAKKESEGIGRILTTRRIEGLADGIFAFAMTLLILSLGLPEDSSGNLLDLLLKSGHMFYNWMLSFILLAVFWIVHHVQGHAIERTDTAHVWINVILLMFVTLVPFSTDLAIDYSGQTAAELVFGANLFVLGLCFCANWTYATWNHRLVEKDLSHAAIVAGIRRSVVMPVVALVAMAIALFVPRYGLYTYMVIPIILSLPWMRRV
ncbi:MAG: TMEM175 family protein [Chloroflexota bacterium]